MIQKLKINDVTKSPFRHLPDVFANGDEFEFSSDINIIVGENGCGKSTLLNLIKKYLLIEGGQCSEGVFRSTTKWLSRDYLLNDHNTDSDMFSGIDLYADWENDTFALVHDIEVKEMNERQVGGIYALVQAMDNGALSTGESVISSIELIMNRIFSSKSQPKFDYSFVEGEIPLYWEYINSHRIDDNAKVTLLMDEPDRNLSLKKLKEIKGVLSYQHPQVQLIAVVHHPLLIAELSKCDYINFIEMSPHYLRDVRSAVRAAAKTLSIR